MGPLKEALHMEVCRHLQGVPQQRILLTSLNSPINGPVAVRNTWATLRGDAGRAEGIKKTTGLQAVLAERPDLFVFHTTEKGHLMIELAAAGCALNPAAASSAALVPSATDVQDVSSSAAAGAHSGGTWTTALPPGPISGATTTFAALIAGVGAEAADPEARRAKLQKTAAGDKSKGRAKAGFHQDIVWTAQLAHSTEREKKKHSGMGKALFTAAEMHGGRSVTLSQIGADFKVSQLKKDHMFKNLKLLDILKQYENVFELVPDGAGGGWTVTLQPGAQAALPDAEEHLEKELQEMESLPERIENPRNERQRMQALRVELLHALSRRGGRVTMQELGQEPRVQQRKQALSGAKKLIDFVRLFPQNFRLSTDQTQTTIIELVSMDVGDQTMIDNAILRNAQAAQGLIPSKGGKGGRPSRPFQHARSQPPPPQPQLVMPPPITNSAALYGQLGYGQLGQLSQMNQMGQMGQMGQLGLAFGQQSAAAQSLATVAAWGALAQSLTGAGGVCGGSL